MADIIKTSIIKMEYYAQILLIDLNMVGYFHFAQLEEGACLKVSFLDSHSSKELIIQDQNDKDADDLRKLHLDVYTQWKNNQKANISAINRINSMSD